MAPEMFYYVSGLNPESSEYTNAVDIWAVGCITYRMLNMKSPFPDLYSLKRYCSNPKLPEFPAGLFEGEMGAENFVRRLLTPHPGERLTASTALDHPWLSISDQTATISRSHISQISAHAFADNKPEAVSNDMKPPSGALNRKIQYNYNTASHAGLRSCYLPDIKAPAKPLANNPWPIAGLLRTREPTLGGIDVEQIDSLGFYEDSTTAVKEEQEPTAVENQGQRVKERQNLTPAGKQRPTGAKGQKLPDGMLVASASADKTVRLWDSTTGAARRTLEGHSNGVCGVAFSPDGKLVASASGDKTVRLWDSATGAARRTLEGHSDWVQAVAFSPDGKLVASASQDKTVRLWDSTTGAARRTLESHSDWVEAVAFSPDGKLVASASRDKTVRLWDSTTGAARRTLEGHSSWVQAVAFSPDGELVASASMDKTVRLWNSTTGAARRTLKGHSSWVEAVAFSPDGKLVASASADKTVRLRDSTTGAARRTLKGHSDWVYAVVFSPDGKLVASASRDKTVRLWDSTTGAARRTLEGHSNGVCGVAFSPDGKLVASASYDGTVRLWDSTTEAVGKYPL